MNKKMTIKELKEIFNIQFEKKLAKNYIARCYIHDGSKTINKLTRKAVFKFQYLLDYNKEEDNDEYSSDSRLETFILNVIDICIFDLTEPKLNYEKIEIYRKFLNKKITLEQLKEYKFEMVTH